MDTTFYNMVVPYDSIIAFKVVAVNDGGLSFPSEVLTVCSRSDARGEALIVNAYDRICGSDGFTMRSSSSIMQRQLLRQVL